MKGGQVIGACSAVAAVSTACFGYLLTWPFFLSGTTLIAFATSIGSKSNSRKESTKKVILFNIGLTFILLSSFFFYKNTATSNANKILAKKTKTEHIEADIPTSDTLKLLKSSEPLGYRYKPGTSGRSRKQLANGGQTIYDVSYTIDVHGNRVTPRHSNTPSRNKHKRALFIGGSFTF